MKEISYRICKSPKGNRRLATTSWFYNKETHEVEPRITVYPFEIMTNLFRSGNSAEDEITITYVHELYHALEEIKGKFPERQLRRMEKTLLRTLSLQANTTLSQFMLES